jgi:hypothetical protein
MPLVLFLRCGTRVQNWALRTFLLAPGSSLKKSRGNLIFHSHAAATAMPSPH